MENNKIWGYEDKEILDHRELYVVGYDPYKQEGSLGSVYIYRREKFDDDIVAKYIRLKEELDNYIMYDPYYYQYYVENSLKAQTWANKVIEENKKMIDGKDWISDLLFGYSEVHING